MEYKIVTENTVGKTETAINQLLKEGWQLNGYLCMSILPDGMGQNLIKYIQVMIKYPTAQNDMINPVSAIKTGTVGMEPILPASVVPDVFAGSPDDPNIKIAS